MLTDLFSSFDPSQSALFLTSELMFWALPLAGALVVQPGYWMSTNRHRQGLSVAQRLPLSLLAGRPHPEAPLFFTSVFFVLLWLNLSGLWPYTFAYSAQLPWVAALAGILWTSFTLSGWFYSPTKSAAKLVPQGVSPVAGVCFAVTETIGKLAQPLTLTFRLVANLTAGHVLLGLVATMVTSLVISQSYLAVLAGAGFLALFSLEMGIAVLQAYIFCLLLSVYLGDHPSK